MTFRIAFPLDHHITEDMAPVSNWQNFKP